MPSFNRVTLIGNLTRDPQVKQLPTTTVAEIGLATSRRFKTASGEEREEVCFVDCTAFGRQAETIAQYCTKGRSIFIEGRLHFSSWEDRDGGKRSKLTVIIENFQFLGSKPQDGGRSDGQRIDRSTDQTADEVPGSTDVTRAPNRRSRETVPLQAEPPFGDEQKFTDDEIPFAWSGRQQQDI